MKKGIDLYILLGLFFVITVDGYAKGTSGIVKRDTMQSIAIRFDEALNEVDSTYANNRAVIAWLDSMLTGAKQLSSVDAVTVTTYVLPKGNAKFNTWLAAMRRVTMKDFLKQRYPQLSQAKVRALQVADDVGIRKAMVVNPELDRSDIQISWSVELPVADAKERAPQPVAERVVYTVGEARRLIEAEYAAYAATAKQAPVAVAEKVVKTEAIVGESQTAIALKNNLLYDLALAPNVEVEVPIGRRWSLNTEYKCPWWVNDNKDFCYQLLSGGIEVRCWLGNRLHRTRLTGHFFGLYAEGGVYDFQFGGDGYQGKYYGASGLTYGYSWSIARHLALEFSFGVGYLTTEYRKYAPYKNDLIWTNSGRYNFIGPTKAKVSLVWLITTRR